MVLQSGDASLMDQLIDSPLLPWQVLLGLAVLFSAGVLYRLARPEGQWARRLRSRLVLGLPWATLASMAFVVGVYLFVQGAIANLYEPVTIAFQATGYSYPLGILTAAFAHTGFNHLFGNLIGALVFGSIAEYGYSHFPTNRGTSSFASAWTNPFARIAIFFVGILVVGLLMAAFSWGPVIGFSGVVFAMAGFALVVRPLTAIVGLLLTQSGAVRLVYNAIMNPISSVGPTPSSGSVWFANIAIQGHLYGFLVGVLAAAALLWYRRSAPSVSRTWAAAVIFGAALNLWVAYFPLGNSRYALFRAPGLAFVFVLAVLVVVTVRASSLRHLPKLTFRRGADIDFSLSEHRGAVAAAGVMAFILLAMMATGAIINLATVGTSDLPNDPVEIRDYQVGYTENATNQQYSLVGVGDISNVEASGVIVASQQRNVWQVQTTTNNLAFRGYSRVRVGGLGWREEVLVTRTAWSVVGGKSTYWVRLHTDDVRRTVFTSGPATSEVVIANRSISLRTVEENFQIVVMRDNQTLDFAGLPQAGANATVGDIRFERIKNRLYANFQGTRVQVANKKEPRIAELQDRQ